MHPLVELNARPHHLVPALGPRTHVEVYPRALFSVAVVRGMLLPEQAEAALEAVIALDDDRVVGVAAKKRRGEGARVSKRKRERE